MRRTPFYLAVIFFTLASLTAYTSQAQIVTAGLAYSTHVEDPGISLGGFVPVANAIEAGGDFTYYFTDDPGAVDFTIWTINLLGKYTLLDDGGPKVSAVGGFNILHWSGSYGNDFGGFGAVNFDESGTDVGLAAGGMVEVGAGSFGFYGKAHAVIGGDSSGAVVAVGVKKNLGH